MTNVVETVSSFLENYNLNNKTICLGFSGGFDSMCLLHVLYSLGCNVVAVHLNHNWRGEESRQEEANCREVCEKLGIQFYSEFLSEDIPHTETAARDARYKFFKQCLQKFNSEVFLTAHNADDNAETVLYRIVKGTGVDGLCAIAPRRDYFYRPLLGVRRVEIEKYCLENNLRPNQDSSNNDIKYKRNLIRHNIIPLLKTINPDVINALNSLSELAVYDCEVLNQYNWNRSTADFLQCPKAIQGRIIKKLLADFDLVYDRERVEMLIGFVAENRQAKSAKTCSLSSDLLFYVNCSEFNIIKKKSFLLQECSVKAEGVYDLGQYLFSIEKCAEIPQKFPLDSDYTAYITLKDINFTIRTRRDGDIIYPLGVGGRQKLKKYFNEKKIPSFQKDNIILICQGQEVLWVAGYGISDKIKVIDNNVTHVLKLQKKGG